ncbi:MAG: glucuronyl hydrolase [Candidatus Latescibacterota bacterium]
MAEKLILIFLLFFGTAATVSAAPQENPAPVPVDACFVFAGEQLTRAVEETADSTRFPRFTGADGKWVTVDSHQWSSGFFAGCLWLIFEHTGDNVWKNRAARWTAGMEREQHNRDNHNNGFMMLPGFGNALRLTGGEHNREVLIESARSLASRYDARVGMIKAMDGDVWKFPVLVDTMVNIELLFRAAENGGDPQWKTIAETHALRTMRDHVRPDGSTVQLVDYDLETGKIREKGTLCGLSGESAWARGQAQAIYGFAAAYRETKNPAFLKTACRVADYFIAHLPADKVPYWDFRAPGIPDEIRDSSAASIAVVGLLELAGQVKNSREKRKYTAAAKDILRSLCSPAYLANGTETRGLLKHATWKKPTDPQADTSLIWGDYYFLEGLKKWGEINR